MTDLSRYHRHGAHQGGSDSWRTPKHIFNVLNNEFKFTHDLAATCSNTLCENYFVDALSSDWTQVQSGYCNPPYSEIESFLALAHLPQRSVFLIPARTQTSYFVKHIFANPFTQEIRWCHRGMRFIPPDQQTTSAKLVRAPLPVVIVVFSNQKRESEIRQTVVCSDTLLTLNVINRGSQRGRQSTYSYEHIDPVTRLWEKGERNIRNIAALTDIPKSTVHRIVSKLER